MQEQNPRSEGLSQKSGGPRGWLLPLTFLVLASVLWMDPWGFASPVSAAKAVPEWAADPTPVRQPVLRPTIQLAGFTFECTECHGFFPSPSETLRPLTQHRHIERKHGINNRCFNCHHRQHRNAFVDDKGAPIPYDEPQELCAKCHGPVYRDWTHGVHGRTNGYWNTSMGPMERRKCVECHDPHAPAFGSMPPAPGPHTLRMGPEVLFDEHSEERNPLNIYGQMDAAAKRSGAEATGH